MSKSLLHGLGALAHAHPLGALIGGVAVGVFVIGICRGLFRQRARQDAYGVERGGAASLAVLAVFILGAFWLSTRMHAAKAAKAAHTVVTHVVTHQVVKPGRPTLTGTEVTLIIVAGLVVVLVVLLNRRRES